MDPIWDGRCTFPEWEWAKRKILAVAVILGKREKKEAEKVFEDICVRTKIAPIVTELEKIFDYFPNVWFDKLIHHARCIIQCMLYLCIVCMINSLCIVLYMVFVSLLAANAVIIILSIIQRIPIFWFDCSKFLTKQKTSNEHRGNLCCNCLYVIVSWTCAILGNRYLILKFWLPVVNQQVKVKVKSFTRI